MRVAPLLAAVLILGATPVEAGMRGWLADRAARIGLDGTEERHIAVGGKTRTYRLHLPPRHDAPLPLVLDFHGHGLTAARQENLSKFSERADREGFIAVYPQADGPAWRAFGRDEADVSYIEAVIADVSRIARVDPDRIYASGISNGAQMAARIACARPGTFAAIALVAGGFFGVCESPRPPALIFHGTADRILAYDGGGGRMPIPAFAAAWATSPGCTPTAETVYRKGDATAIRRSCPGAESTLVTLENKGHSWPGSNMPDAITSRDIDATDEIWAFFRAHNLAGR